MRRKHKGALVAFGVICCLMANAQREVRDDSNWKDRIYVGGGGGLNAGTDTYGSKYFSFSLSPVVGYMVTSQFSVGTGLSYQKVNFSDRGFSYSQYAIMPFVRYNFKEFFLTTEYNYINLPQIINQNGKYVESTRVYRSRLLAGAGYSQRLGDRLSVNVVAMYDLIYKGPSSGFLSPWVFRVFFSF